MAGEMAAVGAAEGVAAAAVTATATATVAAARVMAMAAQAAARLSSGMAGAVVEVGWNRVQALGPMR